MRPFITLIVCALVCGACQKVVYTNQEFCSQFSETLAAVEVNLDRCNSDILYFREIRRSAADKAAAEFATEQTASFREFNEYLSKVERQPAVILEEPAHDTVVLQSYDGPQLYRVQGAVRLSKNEDEQWDVWFETKSEGNRFWIFDTDRVPPFIFESVRGCGGPGLCAGEFEVLIVPDEIPSMSRATLVYAQLFDSTPEQARQIIEYETYFCVRTNGDVRCQ